MRIVGLTGGIASGKSTVSNLFKASGIPVVDADVVARNVLKKGSGGWKRVVAAFGEEILLPSREVDRPKLGQMVFSSDSKRQLLNKLMAPYISSGIFWEILKQWANGAKVIVVDIPLLFEVKMDKWTKPIVVVWVSQETQLKRLMERDGLSEEDARNRVMAQMPLDSKRSKADIVIDNNGGINELHQQFDKVLFEIRRPLTWFEFWRSRQGAFSVLGSVILGVIASKQLKIGS
ncbi:Dephospho-CoA kinase [Cardamine amara subsp. amara]|uniref:Dephospho-CoA kinase n=1 Tax=Cardamine amara subsp. amara TaxID=228776 RepID=A0ABD1AXD2_CARAN